MANKKKATFNKFGEDITRSTPNFRMLTKHKEALKTHAQANGMYVQEYIEHLMENLDKIDVVLF